MAVQINRKRILAGLPINEKSEPIGRVCLKDCCEYLIRLNLKDAVDRRCILCFIFASAGRAGEVSMTRYSHMFFNTVQEHLHINWQQVKVLTPKELTYFADALCPEICVIHSLFCYRASGLQVQGNQESDLVFPLYEKDCSTKVTSILRTLKENVKGIPPDATGTCLRVGAVEEILMCPGLNIIHAVRRGGWMLECVITLLEYALTSTVTVSEGGKGLCGYRFPKRPVKPPRLRYFVDGTNKDTVLALMQRMLNTTTVDFVGDYRLISEFCFATWLLWYPYWIRTYGEFELTTLKFRRVCEELRIMPSTVSDWCKKVKSGYNIENALQHIAVDEGLAAPLKDSLQMLSTDLHTVCSENRELTLQVQQLRMQQNEIMNTIQQLTTTNERLTSLLESLSMSYPLHDGVVGNAQQRVHVHQQDELHRQDGHSGLPGREEHSGREGCSEEGGLIRHEGQLGLKEQCMHYTKSTLAVETNTPLVSTPLLTPSSRQYIIS